jgi:hypothetical protein
MHIGGVAIWEVPDPINTCGDGESDVTMEFRLCWLVSQRIKKQRGALQSYRHNGLSGIVSTIFVHDSCWLIPLRPSLHSLLLLSPCICSSKKWKDS